MERHNHALRTLIIADTLLFIDTQDVRYKENAIANIKIFAKNYRTPLSSLRNPIPIIKALTAFVTNAEGYNNTIQILYRSLN